jgi:hypothetical protein
LSRAPLERQVDGVVRNILGGTANRSTIDVMLTAGTGDSATSAEPSYRLREVLSIALSSPEFQRR